MKITKSQFKIIEHLLPVQRGNVKLPNIQVINAILYITEHGEDYQNTSAIGIAFIPLQTDGPK